MKTFIAFMQKNSFVLLLLIVFLGSNLAISAWDPMTHSLRFYKNDFTKTLLHHDWIRSGPVFFGNSAVTGAYMEDKAQVPLVEMGLSYGKITDLKGILEQDLYDVKGPLVIGIDAHTMLDKLQTDDTYPWLKKWYQPYVYAYRDYFRDSGAEWVRHAIKADFISYEPRWTDKMLYYGRKSHTELQEKWQEYDKRFGWMTVERDLNDNVEALRWVVHYAEEHHIPVKVIWMPLHPNPAYPHPPYIKPLKETVNEFLQAEQVPVLDLMNTFKPEDFHDIVHLNREVGAPKFTREVDRWLLSFESSPKS